MYNDVQYIFFVCEAFHPNSTNPYVISMFPLCQWWLQQHQVSWRYCSSLGAPCNPARGIWPHHIVRWWRWRITQFVPKKMPMVFRFKIMATRFFFGKKTQKRSPCFFLYGNQRFGKVWGPNSGIRPENATHFQSPFSPLPSLGDFECQMDWCNHQRGVLGGLSSKWDRGCRFQTLIFHRWWWFMKPTELKNSSEIGSLPYVEMKIYRYTVFETTTLWYVPPWLVMRFKRR